MTPLARRAIAIAVAAVAVTVATAVVALSGDRDRAAAPPDSNAPASTAPVSTAPSAFNGTDAAWLQLMIALDEGALRLVDLTAPRTSDAALRTLVLDIGASHRAELVHLRRLGTRASLPAKNEHDDHEMPGMVTTARLARIGALADAEFDRTVRETLREHLTQGVNLSTSEQKSGAEPETVQLAQRIAQQRTTHLTRL